MRQHLCCSENYTINIGHLRCHLPAIYSLHHIACTELIITRSTHMIHFFIYIHRLGLFRSNPPRSQPCCFTLIGVHRENEGTQAL